MSLIDRIGMDGMIEARSRLVELTRAAGVMIG